MKLKESLSIVELYRQCDPDQFDFETTADLDDTIAIIGQDRAVEAIQFGITIAQDGYNLFALGPNGVGKYTAVCRYLDQQAKDKPIPPDWCYVHNFEQPHQPNAISLPAGKGNELCRDMENLLDELFTVLPATFKSEEYQVQRQAIQERLQARQEEGLEQLNEEARQEDVALIKTQQGLAIAPLKNGEVIRSEEFQKLSDEDKEKYEGTIEKFQNKLQRLMRQVPQWSRESREEVKQLNQEMATFAVAPLFKDELIKKYEQFPEVVDYLQAVKEDVIENADKFLQSEDSASSRSQQNPLMAAMQARQQMTRESPFFNRYQVNLLVDNSQTSGAPVIYADHPTFANLIGRIEHEARMGALFTDFTMIKQGSLHRANGGYLILDARKVLLNPQSWEGLKRALQSDELKIEPLEHSLGLISTASLEPEPIPLDVKIILLGERHLYYLLYQLDPDFGELFKVAADFEEEMERDEANNRIYAQFISSLVRREALQPFSRQAVARIIEYSSRLAGDAEKLSTHMQPMADLMRESSYWSAQNDHDLVQPADVQKAIDAQKYRNGRLRERMQEAILRDTVLIDTEDTVVGQINALSVIAVGQHAFGRPSRITARVRLGKGEVIDIERKVEMGGPLHSKGVMILSGFLGGRYAEKRPLSLTASLVFEQSYGGVDGDSASSAELYALLSAMADAPIKQSFAVTGSVNQRGQVQAIGGVNEKIEGFFDICQARGLTGEQGVLIPAANVKNLMLRHDVVEAVADGQFHIFALETIDQGIELLTGVEAGVMGEDGRYPPESINRRVADYLDTLAETQRSFHENGQVQD
ncbi:MAG: ATP-dependent protease [Anaerolineaceae bacterium]|nr:ATP-dependent protease [Anaerolineaceae bacterium]